jgi:hypothetical protein
MLRITKLADADYLIGQVGRGIDDYYMGIGEAPGVWHGRLADELGMWEWSGTMTCGRCSWPATREPTQCCWAAIANGAAFDVTFSAPKSVSVLWAFASPEVSLVASIAHVEAVAVALAFLERRAGATRQQVDGDRHALGPDRPVRGDVGHADNAIAGCEARVGGASQRVRLRSGLGSPTRLADRTTRRRRGRTRRHPRGPSNAR